MTILNIFFSLIFGIFHKDRLFSPFTHFIYIDLILFAYFFHQSAQEVVLPGVIFIRLRLFLNSIVQIDVFRLLLDQVDRISCKVLCLFSFRNAIMKIDTGRVLILRVDIAS